MIIDLVATSVVIGIAWVLLMGRLRAVPAGEARVIQASFLMHLLASVATMVVSQVIYKGVVDFNGFRVAGEMIADEMRQDFWGVAPRAVKLFFHSENAIINVPLNLEPKGGKSTVSMWIIAAFGNLLFFRSFQATATACALFSFSGKLAMLTVLRTYFPERLRPAVAAALLLVPSVVYWTSGLIKEGIAVGGLGFALLGAHRLVERRPSGILALMFGVSLILTIKPYLLMPFGVGMAALLYSHRSRGADGLVRIRPLWLVGAGVVAIVGMLVVGRLFPQFSVDTLGEQAAQMQGYGRKAAGGSFYVLGDPNERSLAGQLQFAPLALFTALYRPLIIESNNAQALINSLETTALLGITLVLFVQRGWRAMLATVISNPALAYAIAFTLPLALGVGLVSNNLGTLSRYRCPMVPYFVLTLLMLYQARGSELIASVQKRVAPAPAPVPASTHARLPPPSARPRPAHSPAPRTARTTARYGAAPPGASIRTRLR
jgi:hypothetical protein